MNYVFVNRLAAVSALVYILTMTSCQPGRPVVVHSGEPVNKSGKVDGEWYWENADTVNSFKINLIVYSDSVFGEYCAAHNKGKELDCEFNTTYNMHGTKAGDSVSLHFNTFYHAHDGIAIVKLKGNSLVWDIIKMPVGGSCLAPQHAVMYRHLENW